MPEDIKPPVTAATPNGAALAQPPTPVATPVAANPAVSAPATAVSPVMNTGMIDRPKPVSSEFLSELDAEFKPSTPGPSNEEAVTGTTTYPTGRESLIVRYRAYGRRLIAVVIVLLLGLSVSAYAFISHARQSNQLKPTTHQPLATDISTTQTPFDYTLSVNGQLKVRDQTTLNKLLVNGPATFKNGISTNRLDINGQAVIVGALQATTVSGNGGGLTNVDANTLNGISGAFFLNSINANTAALSDAALKSADNNFTGSNSFGTATNFASDITVQGTLNGQSAVYSTDVSALTFTQNGNFVCDSSGNCGAGGGGVAGTGTAGSIPVFTGVATIGDSLLSQSGGAVTVAGSLNASGLSSTGTITFGSLGAGLVQTDGSGVISSSNLSRNSALLTGQTSVANGGTGATTAAGARTNLGAAASGANSDITSLSTASSVTNNGPLTLQGNASTVLNASESGFITSVGFNTPTANVNYIFATTTAGTYTICTTAGNCTGAGGGVTTSGGTSGTIALFTGSQTIGDSLLSQSGTTVTVSGTLAATALQGSGAAITNLNGSNIASGTVGVSVGGTGRGSFTTNGVVYGNNTGALQVTAAGLTGDCLVGNTGSAPTWLNCVTAAGGATPGGAAGGDLGGTYPNPTVVGLYSTPLSIASLTTGNILIFDGTNWINAAVSGDITVSAAGVATIANGAVTNAKLANSSVTVTAGTGLTGGGAVSLGNSISLNVAYGATSTTAARGDKTIVCPTGTGNLSGGGDTITIGSGGTCSNLTITSTPTFSSLTLTTPLSVANGGTGAATAATARTNLGAAASGANSDITSLSGLSTPLSASQGGTGVTGPGLVNGKLLIGNGAGWTVANLTQGSGISITNGSGSITIAVDNTICTTAGNCAGAGSGVTTAGGTTNTIALFTGSQAIGDSILTQSGTTITVGGTLAATALQGDGSAITALNATNLASGTVASARISGSYTGITGVGALTVGSIGSGFGTISTGNTISTSAALQGNTLSIGSGTFTVNATGAITAATGLTTTGTVTLSNLNTAGVVHTNASGVLSTSNVLLGTDTTGDYVTSLGTLTGLTTTGNSGAGSNPTLSVTYGVAANTAAQGNTALSFTGAGNLTGTVSGTSGGGLTSNTLAVVSNPTFSGLVTASGGLAVTDVTASSSLTLSFATAGVLRTDGSGHVTSNTLDRNSALLNGQTSVANGGTGSTTAPGALTNLGAAASGANSDITSLTAAASVGLTSAALTLQGNSSTTFTGTSGSFTTTLGFATPTANVTYQLGVAAAGTYTLCSTAGNCSGVGGGVTTSGGTIGTIALFTASQGIGDSIISQSGSVITVGGTLTANALQSATFDTATGVGLSLGATNATSITLGKSGVNSLVQGSLGVNTNTPTATLDLVGNAPALSGTGTLVSVGTTVTGTGTSFTTQLHVGDSITAAGQTRTVMAIASNTSLTASSNFSPVLSAAAFTYTQPATRLTSGGVSQQALFVQGAASSTVPTFTLKLGAGQTGDLFDVVDDTGTVLNKVSSAGGFFSSGNIGAGTLSAVNNSTGGTARLSVSISSATNTDIVARGAPSQTANIVEIQNSDGSILSGFNSNGALITYGTGVTIGNLAVPSGVTSSTSGGTSFYYKVTAYNNTGETTASSEVSGSAAATTISWTVVPGAMGYHIYRGTSSGAEAGYFDIVSGTVTSKTSAQSMTLTGASAPPPTTAGNGLTLQAWSGQTANLLNLQNSAGTSVLSVSPTGGLTAVTATFNGTLTVNGHIISGNTSGSTTIAAGAAANCAGAATGVTVTGNDTAGRVNFTTGTGACAAGIFVTVTFSTNYGSAPIVLLTPRDANSATLQYYAGSGVSTFTVNTGTAATASTAYSYNYQIMQ